MRTKRSKVAKAASAAAAVASTVATSSNTAAPARSAHSEGSSGKKRRQRQGKPKSRGWKTSAQTALKKKRPVNVAPNLTPLRLTNIVNQLGNKRGSTVGSIRSKLMRSGYNTNTPMIRSVLDRAVKCGLLRVVREERFTLLAGIPSTSGTAAISANEPGTSSGRRGQRRQPGAKKRAAAAGTSTSASSASSAKRRQRRRPGGRRRAENAADGQGDDNTDAGNGASGPEEGNGSDNAAQMAINAVDTMPPFQGVKVFGNH